MNKKILGIFVCMLLVGMIIPVSGDVYQRESTVATIYDGSLLGYVYDNDMNPINGARVRVYFHETYEEDYSDSTGFYHVTDIPICYCMKNATASKQGYSTEWILLGIVENTIHDFVLTKLIPIPDLDCDGTLYLEAGSPGDTVTGTITIENIGDPDSLLNWEIESFPEWGTWTFDPASGVDLLAGDFQTIEVELVLPDEMYDGEIVIVNSDDPYDFCTVDVRIVPAPPPQGYFYIGMISDPEISEESIMFHADLVFVFKLIIPTGILTNEDVILPNNYIGHIGERFIFARIID